MPRGLAPSFLLVGRCLAMVAISLSGILDIMDRHHLPLPAQGLHGEPPCVALYSRVAVPRVPPPSISAPWLIPRSHPGPQTIQTPSSASDGAKSTSQHLPATLGNEQQCIAHRHLYLPHHRYCQFHSFATDSREAQSSDDV
ncbi:hypothetical protein BO94DRAFT_238112 [Aspergillus sclerotioniger CBS 115572]|uniref:Uncharacterized protein n=1 Tax=Aspergillus sclerotioniger CBS 115572 TaxID=1450535 RepID=A0A317VKV9_9EURO|nr:hypothetical protein BO94DRAFT_238112 [Aspergillus sclerotioniger CBS 115572]PWY73881.1 hypothetical protein BO94DRAFT_238112 [Aspergillus sclerotioniger CBS 115572]